MYDVCMYVVCNVYNMLSLVVPYGLIVYCHCTCTYIIYIYIYMFIRM
jgi:hypothetical protein